MKKAIVVLAAVILFTSCLKKNEVCQYDPCAVSAPSTEITDLESYLSSAGISATRHCSGMYYIIEAAGNGTAPTICSFVTVKYTGMLTNGNIFDQATTPVTFQSGGFIEAWKKGLSLMKTGGKLKLYCPPSLAYGSQEIRDGSGNVLIPANSILIFDIELVAVS